MTEHPRIWPLKCSECGDRVKIELSADTEEGTTGTAKCHRGHILRRAAFGPSKAFKPSR